MTNDSNLKHKEGEWLLKGAEDAFKNTIVPHIPRWIETYHLTALTLVWSVLMVASFYFGREYTVYLYLVPLIVLLQYVTDLLDGTLGRYRKTGLVTWGYYVDHFLDFIFMVSIVFGYGLVVGFNIWLFLWLAILSGLMIQTFLLVSAQGSFHVSFLKLGPTEGRLLFIIFHSVVVFVGIEIFDQLLPFIVLFSAALLISVTMTAQKLLWRKDLKNI